MTNQKIDELLDDLQFGTKEERANAVEVLGEKKYAPAVPRLTTIVREADPGTRYMAAIALSRIGDEAESASDTLLETLRDDDMFLRAAVTGALISIGQPAVSGLIQALFDDNKAVRRASAKALGKIGDENAVSPLAVALKDTDKGVRKFAREALQRIDTPQAREALKDE
jgi:HEAT repeat protein